MRTKRQGPGGAAAAWVPSHTLASQGWGRIGGGARLSRLGPLCRVRPQQAGLPLHPKETCHCVTPPLNCLSVIGLLILINNSC